MQHSECKEHYKRECTCILPRIFDRAIGGGHGFCDFITTSQLSHSRSGIKEFLKHDRLNFRIVSVEMCEQRIQTSLVVTSTIVPKT